MCCGSHCYRDGCVVGPIAMETGVLWVTLLWRQVCCEVAWSDHHGDRFEGIVVRVFPGEPDNSVGTKNVPLRRVGTTLVHRQSCTHARDVRNNPQ